MKLPLVARKNIILVICNRLFKMIYFMATTERTLVKGLVRLFKDNVWKLYGFPESITLDRSLQFVVEMIKELNKLKIETKLSILFYPQTEYELGVRIVFLILCRS